MTGRNRLFSLAPFASLLGLQRVSVHTDGAIRLEAGASGLAAVVHDEQNIIRHLWSKHAGRMTCNEAEYAAAILALEKLFPLQPMEVKIFSDSQVMVHQMTGIASAQSPQLSRRRPGCGHW